MVRLSLFLLVWGCGRIDFDPIDGELTFGSVLAISAGGRHTCAILTGGRVRCWGRNLDGQLGQGHDLSLGDDELPSAIPDLDLGRPAIAVAAGFEHTCVLLDDGHV